jgi:sugar O-acyltransferase (sialic acid O-acetyltransferase NeuD family)
MPASPILNPAAIGVLLYGGGGHAAVLGDVLEAMGESVAGIFAATPPTRDWGHVPYLGPYQPGLHPDLPLILAIGDNRARREAAQHISHRWFTALHPSVLLSPTARVEEGSVLYHGSIVQAGARVGRHVIINTGATVDHDCTLADYVHIAPGVNLCGGVEVGEGTLIGVGAKIIPGIKIGAWSIVGAGSIVLRNVPAGATVVGVVR